MTDNEQLAYHVSSAEYQSVVGSDILGRTEGFLQWQEARASRGVWPYSRAHLTPPGTYCEIQDSIGARTSGVNFASQDYLSLSNHPEIKDAARRAIDEFGVHSAGSSILVGGTTLSLRLERKVAELLEISCCPVSNRVGRWIRGHQRASAS